MLTFPVATILVPKLLQRLHRHRQTSRRQDGEYDSRLDGAGYPFTRWTDGAGTVSVMKGVVFGVDSTWAVWMYLGGHLGIGYWKSARWVGCFG